MKRLVYLFLLSLVGCSSAGEERGAANMRAVNHTYGAINWMEIDGFRAAGGGGRTCCIGMPIKWRPDLKVEVEWELDPNPFEDIKKSLVGSGFDKDAFAAHREKYRRYKKIVQIPEWPGEESCEFNVHFFTCGRVAVTTICLSLNHPDYPIKVDREEEPQVCPQ